MTNRTFRAKLATKAEVLARRLLCYYFSDSFPLYIVTEYPRSGGTWFSQMLGDALNVPFLRNEFPRLASQIMHGHYMYDSRMSNVFCVIRDGRDVLTSYYYHCLIKNDKFNAPLVDRVRRELGIDDPENIRAHMPAFIEYTFGGAGPLWFSWSKFVRGWRIGGTATFVRYEDMIDDSARTVGEAILDALGVAIPMWHLYEIAARYTFASQAGRQPGVERAHRFLRKGIVGDWRGKFSLKARELFDRYAGELLIDLGYEQDHMWARREQ